MLINNTLPPPSSSSTTQSRGDRPLTIGPIDESHRELVASLDNQLIGSIPNGFYRHANTDLIMQCLKSGLSLGLFVGAKLVGYRLTFVPALREENLGRMLGMTDEELGRVAQFYGTLLHPDFRGTGQGTRLIEASLDLIVERGFRVVLVTVHPDNQASLSMCLRCGFELVKEITFYGGLPRLLLRKMLTRTQLATN